MSDFFLLPCAIAPPFPSYPRWPLLHTLCLSHAVCAPRPSSLSFFFFSVFTCNLFLNVQCLSCSGALRPSQWIGSFFGAEVTACPPPLPRHSPFLPPLLSSPRTGGRRGKWARRALHGGWQRGSRSTCPGCQNGERGCAACVSPLRTSLVRAGVEGNHPRPVLPPPRTLGPAVSAGTAVRVSVGASPAVSGGRGLALLVKSVEQCNSNPPPSIPHLTLSHRCT